MATDKKFSQFTNGNEVQVGDEVVGLRPSAPLSNFRFDFPGGGIKDANGNYLFAYASAGALAVNYLAFTSSVAGDPVLISANGTDANIDISIQPLGTGKIILDELNWPTADGAPGTFMQTDGFGNLSFTSGVATEIIGTANQVLANGTSATPETGSVTLTTPQDIATTSSPTFNNLKLTGANILDTNSNNILNFNPTALAANYISIKNQVALSAPEINAIGGDTNIGLIYRTKATGAHQFISTNTTVPMIWQSGTTSQHTTSWTIPDTAASRAITLQDASGTMAYLADIIANGTVNAGTANQIAYYATTGTTISGLTGANSAMLYTNATGVPAMSASMTDGQIMIGATGGSPAPATLTAGPGISIANAANSVTISGTGSGIGWTEVAGTSQAMTADNGYVANNAGLVTLTLPVTAAFGTAISIIGKGAGGWLIAQNAGQNIQIGSSSSSVGAGGSVASTNRFDSLQLICTTANTTWTIQGGGQSAGFTIV